MEIEWTDSKGKPIRARIDAHVATYVELIGLENTVALLLACGGAIIGLPLRRARVSRPSMATQLIGPENALKMGEHFGVSSHRLPIAPRFLARYLRSQGMNVSEIARTLRRTTTSVRGYLKPDSARQKKSRGHD